MFLADACLVKMTVIYPNGILMWSVFYDLRQAIRDRLKTLQPQVNYKTSENSL
jgi:hypothetical protein